MEFQVFKNIGLGVCSALGPRNMANAIQAIASRFETPEAAAQHFGRAPTWLWEATAAANLSEKVTALLDAGRSPALAARAEYQSYELEGARLTLAANIITTAVTQARLTGKFQSTEAILGAMDGQMRITQERVRLGQAAPYEVMDTTPEV